MPSRQVYSPLASRKARKDSLDRIDRMNQINHRRLKCTLKIREPTSPRGGNEQVPSSPPQALPPSVGFASGSSLRSDFKLVISLAESTKEPGVLRNGGDPDEELIALAMEKCRLRNLWEEVTAQNSHSKWRSATVRAHGR